MARKRLNVRFLVVLVAVAGALLIVLAVGLLVYRESPGRAIRRAQEFEAQGDWQKAAEQWAKAAKASNDPQYQLRAIDAILKRTSEPNGLQVLQQVNLNYRALLTSDPTLLPALRGQMRLLAGDRGFAGPRPTAATREVRRLAAEVLKQDAADSEARTLRALATLNLSQFTGEGISAEDVEQAKHELRSVAQLSPGNGLAVLSHTQGLLTEADQLRTRGELDAALETWQDTVKLVDEVAAAHEELPADPSLDRARLHWRLGQAYLLAARLKPLLDAAKLASSGTPPSQIDAETLTADPVVAGARRRGYEQITKARGALNGERDLLQEDYREIRVTYADALASQQKAQESEQELRALCADRPWDMQAATTLARVLQQQNRVEEAVAVMRQVRAVEELPPLEGHSGVNARINRMMAKPFEVELLFMRYDAVPDPQQRAAILAEARQIFEEYETQRKAVGLQSTSESVRMLGQIQIAEGDLGAGIQTLTNALHFTAGAEGPAERRERLKVLAMLVDANRRLGQVGAQQRYLEELVQLAPGIARSQRDLAQLYLAQGERQKARAIIERLLRDSPDDAVLQQLALQAVPPEQQLAAYMQMSESSSSQQQAKLGTAIRLGRAEDVIRLAKLLQDGYPPPEQRTPEQQRQHEALTLTIAQQLDHTGNKDQAIALVQPIADKSLAAKALLAQLQGGAEAMLESLPEGVDRLLLEAQLAEMRDDSETGLAKLEEAARIAPANDTVGKRLFSAYLLRQRLEDAALLAEQLRARNADEMRGGTYAVRLALARGDTDQALASATTLARDYPDFAEAHALHGEALRQTGGGSEAVEAFRRSLTIAPNSLGALTGMLSALEAAGRFSEARPYIDEGLRLQPENDFFRNADRAFQIRFADPSNVIEARRIAARDDPASADARLDLGQTLLLAADASERVADEARTQERLIEAAEVFTQALHDFPQDLRMLQGLLAAVTRAGDEALAAAEPAIQASVASPQAPLAGNPQAVILGADYFAARGQLPRAESLVRAALGDRSLSRDQKASLLLALSALLVRQNRPDDALAVLGGYEDVGSVLQRKIELLAQRVAQEPQDAGFYQAMRQASDPGIEDRSLPVGGLTAVAYAEMQRGDIDRTINLLDQALSRQANNSRGLLMRGAVEARRPGGNLESAGRWLDQARTLAPDDPDVYRELSRLYRQRGQQEEAITAMNRLAELEPRDVQARLELVNLLLSMNPPRFSDATRHFRSAERAGIADHPMLLMTRAEMERLRGRLSDGLIYAQRAVEQAEQSGSAQRAVLLQNYLALLLQAEQYQQVLDRIEETRAAGDLPWWALQARGKALAALNRREEAIAAYREAVSAGRALGVDDAVLIDMYHSLGFEATYGLIRDRVEPGDGASPDPRDLLVASALYAGAGRLEQAISMLQTVQSSKPDLTAQQRAMLDSQLGTLFLQVSPRRLDDALTHLRSALQTQPEHLGVLNNLAYTLTLQADSLWAAGDAAAAQDKLREAIQLAGRAHELEAGAARRVGRDPNSTILDTLGWATGLLGVTSTSPEQIQEGLRLLREARRISENAGRPQPEVYLHLSRVLAALNEGESSQEAAETGLAALERARRGPDPMDPHLDAELRAALERAREQATQMPG